MSLICIIVAADENNAIGRGGKLPWHLREDMKYFKKITMSRAVLMGRKTFESIGKPLAGRWNVVLTRDLKFDSPNIEVAHSPQEAIHLYGAGNPMFIIGGEQIYKEFWSCADLIYLTRVHTKVEGADAYIPEIDETKYSLLDSKDVKADEHNDFDMTFEIWRRKG